MAPDTGDQRWAPLEKEFAETVLAYQLAQGRNPDDGSVQGTVRTNSSLVPRRAEIVLRLVRTLPEGPGLRGRAVLEAGTGFGGLASFLALTQAPARLVAVDNRDDLIAAARATVERAGVDAPLEFLLADIRSFRPTCRGIRRGDREQHADLSRHAKGTVSTWGSRSSGAFFAPADICSSGRSTAGGFASPSLGPRSST